VTTPELRGFELDTFSVEMGSFVQTRWLVTTMNCCPFMV
jgi:hypothetical protein